MAQKRQKGFSLLETTVVLVIVMIVLVASWVAIGSVSENKNIEQTISQLSVVAQNVRSLYKGNVIASPTAFTTNAMVLAGVFPGDMLDGGAPISSWGQPISLSASSSTSFTITLSALPAKSCRALLGRYTGQARDPTLLSVTPLPSGGCGSLDFTFNLR